MSFQWYPGHMAKAKRIMQDDMKLIDVVIELVDARIPLSSKNPDIDKLAQNKSRVILLNKFDMADQNHTRRWKDYFESKGYYVALVNSRSGNGVKQVQDIVNKACEAKIERDRKRGILNRPVRAMIVGIPNVGKSTFINTFVGKASTKTGNKPGVTKGKQWIKINKHIELLDTPGILWPKFEDQSVGLKLAYIGSINDTILNMTEMCFNLLIFLHEAYPGVITKRYDIEEPAELKTITQAADLLEKIAVRRGCLLKGGNPDIDKAAILVMDDLRSNKLGYLTLEFPDMKSSSKKQEEVIEEKDVKDKEDVNVKNDKEVKKGNEEKEVE